MVTFDEIEERRCAEIWTKSQDLKSRALSDEQADTVLLDLETLIERHHCLPMALGLGESDVANKMAALVLACWMDTGEVTKLKLLLASCVSCTTDMGTEVGLSSFTAWASARKVVRLKLCLHSIVIRVITRQGTRAKLGVTLKIWLFAILEDEGLFSCAVASRMGEAISVAFARST